MDKNQLIWWPDEKKGAIINAVTARDRASLRFLARRAARFYLPLLPLMLGAIVMATFSRSVQGNDAEWFITFLSWAPTVILACGAALAAFASVAIYAEWRHDSQEAKVLACEVRELGVDVSLLDSDWVLEALILPMIRRKGILLANGELVRLQEDGSTNA